MKIKIGFSPEDAKGLGFYHTDDLKTAQIVSVFVLVGDVVKKGDLLFEIETEKETMEFTSPVDGTIYSLEYGKGEKWEYGGEEDTPLGIIILPHFAEIETEANGVLPKKDITGVETSEKHTEKPAHEQKITPVAKRIAEEHDIDVSSIRGSGPGNRVMKEDVECAIAKKTDNGVSSREQHTDSVLRAVPAARAYAREHGISLSDIRGTGPDGTICLVDVETHKKAEQVESPREENVDVERIVEATEMRKAIARMLDYSWKNIVHAGDTITINVEQIARFRETHNAFSQKLFGMKLRFDHFFLYFAAQHLATKEFEDLNGYWDPEKEEIHIMPHVNLGIAVDVGYGLMVPVIREAETYSFRELAKRVEDCVMRASEKKLTRADFLDLTFTVNNPGALGGEEPAMVIPSTRMKEKSGIRGTTMILGLGKVTPSYNGEREMKTTFRFDHRIVDGRQPLLFMKALKEWCEAETEDQILSRLT